MTTEDPLQYLLARRVLETLESQGGQVSTRIVVDNLPADITDLLFEALLELADTEVGIMMPDDDGAMQRFPLLGIPWGERELVPFLVAKRPHTPRPGAENNTGSVGFASALRDHYAVGAERERVLLVLTAAGNETQKSARDTKADAVLVDLVGLLDEARRDVGVQGDPALERIGEVYLAYRQADEPWRDTVGRYRAYLVETKDEGAAEKGRKLPMLGCFLPDPTPTFASDEEFRVLANAEHRRRARGSSRLHHNALLRDFLEETFRDPLAEPQAVLGEIFGDDPDRGEAIATGGLAGLDDLALGTFEGAGQIQRRQKNQFDRAEIEVHGAASHLIVGSGSDVIAVAAAPSALRVRVALEQPFNPNKEHAQIMRWDDDRGALVATVVEVKPGRRVVEFPLEAPDPGAFEVIRLALTRGPRTMKRPRDEILVVLYGEDADHVIVEGTRRPSLTDQAWAIEGEATFLAMDAEAADGRPVSLLERVADDPEDGGSATFRARLDGTSLQPRVIEVQADEEEPGDKVDFREVDFLEATIHLVSRYSAPIVRAFRKADRYLQAVQGATAMPGKRMWQLDLPGGLSPKVVSATPSDQPSYLYERAVGWVLRHPHTLQLASDDDGLRATQSVEDVSGSLVDVLSARTAALAAVRACAQDIASRIDRADIPVLLAAVDLEPAADAIQTWSRAWRETVRASLLRGEQFDAAHQTLLQLDTLRVLGREGAVDQVVVLPTHPWFLESLLTFQRTIQRALHQGGPFALRAGEVIQLLPRDAVEHWYLGASGTNPLALTDSPPFHGVFAPTGSKDAAGGLDYIQRVVSTKVERYLRMHPHLRHERRTLRIGFVNPGDGRHLLTGLEAWIRTQAGKDLREPPMERIPRLEVFFFTSQRGHHDEMGEAFDAFFQDQVSSQDDNSFRQALMARLAYRKCQGGAPTSNADAVHLCFVRGLVDSDHQHDKVDALDSWWDGAFGDGLLSTPLRRTFQSSSGTLSSRRGLWVDPSAEGGRGSLSSLLALQRACRYGDPNPSKAVFWDAELPDLRTVGAMYDYSDWVVHLDRALSLELFQQLGEGPEGRPTIIEYSDQEVPESPGLDTITVTRRAAPYHEQLTEILQVADLDVPDTRQALAAAHGLLRTLNALSGTWALDFLTGSLADERYSLRLKGNLGAALVYRWLQRTEIREQSTVNTNAGPAVPVIVSLEDLLRATPARGLRKSDGLVHRYSNEVDDVEAGNSWCDDLLVLYLLPPPKEGPARLFGRIIEVKLGTTASAQRQKAIAQVAGTHELLARHLAGATDAVEAPFRHKQLSLLIKSQLEQSVALGSLDRDVYDFLRVPELSRKLATGDYEVDYAIGQDGQHANGDVFLLSTASTTKATGRPEPVLEGGARVFDVPRAWVEWLAFEEEHAPTQVEAPACSQPHLGRYGGAPVAPPPLADPKHLVDEPADASSTSVQPAHAPPEVVPKALPSPPAPASAEAPDGQRRAGAAVEPESIHPEMPGLPAPAVKPATLPPSVTDPTADGLTLAQTAELPVKTAPYPLSEVADVVRRLERALRGHKVSLEAAPSAEEADAGPRLVRAYVRLDPGVSIQSVRRISEDIARVVGTSSADIHISNIPERHAVGLDLPVDGLSYTVTYQDLIAHSSFDAAAAELALGFCAGIDVTGRALWTDLADMPHMLVAGTTGSGKTVFLRNVLLTLLLHRSPEELVLRMSSSKPMDFMPFTQVPHGHGHGLAQDPGAALQLAKELVREMDQRIHVIAQAWCDNLVSFNAENPESALPFVVAVFDEFAEMVSAFPEKQDRADFETAIGRLAQKARAAGIHLILCMQRPDANAIKGAIKANVLHRFALKLPQNHDSRIILDENGAETLLGQGDLLYKDASSRVHRLQVPFLENRYLKRTLRRVIQGQPADGVDLDADKACPKCGRVGKVGELFGTRKLKYPVKDGSVRVVERPQSYCKDCR